jgi:hypothetical protein
MFVIRKSKNQLYLILININTRYLFIYPLKKKYTNCVVQALDFFINDIEGQISSIIADGERAFISRQVLEELHNRGIETNFIKAYYLNHIRMADNVIRTL